MNTRPTTTLFMLMSVDGKISTGNSDERDFDKDLPQLSGIKEGLPQYYALEQQTDLFSFNTGRVMEKIGINTLPDPATKLPVSFIIVDNKPHLTAQGVLHLLKKTKRLFLVTTNKKHPAFKITDKNLVIIYFPKQMPLEQLFNELKTKYKIDAITLQSGGSMNAELLRHGLIDTISIVVAPCLIGGKDTATLIDGKSLLRDKDLASIAMLELKKAEVLKDNYLHLKYLVLKNSR